MGHLTDALPSFQQSVLKGRKQSVLHVAYLLEQLGYPEEAKVKLNDILQYSMSRGLPAYHIRIKLATLSFRIMPANLSEITLLHERHSNDIMSLLQMEEGVDLEIDNLSPLSIGYSLGYNYLFHAAKSVAEGGNRGLKELLYRLYVRICPALLQGFFIDSTLPLSARETTDISLLGQQDNKQVDESSHQNTAEESTEGKDEEEEEEASLALPTTISTPKRIDQQEEEIEDQLIPSSSTGNSSANHRVIKVGFISRYFFHHPVGTLSNGLMELLSGKTKYPGVEDLVHNRIELHILLIDGGPKSLYHDHLQARMIRHSEHIHYLQIRELGLTASYIRSIGLDVLIYPEIGLDPVTYFLAFARLASVQMTWLGHPETSGIANIDYFITSDIEKVNVSKVAYSESLISMPDFGTMFLDIYKTRAKLQLQSSRTVLLNRMKFIENVGIPKLAHLYVVPHSTSKIHPDFDVVVRKILLQDRLAYIMFVEIGQPRTTWEEMFVKRVLGKHQKEDVKERILFPTPMTPNDMIGILQIAHVMLEPFPISGNFEPSLEALAIGIPVITWPVSQHVGGKMTLALYKMLDYGFTPTYPPDSSSSGSPNTNVVGEDGLTKDLEEDNSLYCPLVVDSLQDYVNTAMKLTHQPKVREFHVQQILARRERLFQTNATRVVEAWTTLFRTSLKQRGKY